MVKILFKLINAMNPKKLSEREKKKLASYHNLKQI